MPVPVLSPRRAAVAAVALIAGVAAVAAEQEPARRAARPKFPPEVVDVFFADARQQLVGQRPHGADASSVAGDGGATAAGDSNAPQFAWSQLVSGETLADEVKRTANALRAPLANPGKFRAGGYQSCRAAFSQLAVLFAVIEQYDGDVRFKSAAPGMSGATAHAASVCKAASDDSYKSAQACYRLLEDLLSGGAVDAPASEPAPWSELAERPLLMQRMEAALNEQIQPALANDRNFRRQDLDVLREAQLLAMLAEVIQREDYDYRDDEDYTASAQQLRDAASALARAAEDGNYEAARAAAGRASQSCTVCHEGFRG